MDTTTETKAKAPKMTSKRAIEEAGFGTYWSMLNDADKEAVARRLRAGTVAEASTAYEAAKVKASALTQTAEAARTEAIEAEKAYQAVLTKCREFDKLVKG